MDQISMTTTTTVQTTRKSNQNWQQQPRYRLFDDVPTKRKRLDEQQQQLKLPTKKHKNFLLNKESLKSKLSSQPDEVNIPVTSLKNLQKENAERWKHIESLRLELISLEEKSENQKSHHDSKMKSYLSGELELLEQKRQKSQNDSSLLHRMKEDYHKRHLHLYGQEISHGNLALTHLLNHYESNENQEKFLEEKLNLILKQHKDLFCVLSSVLKHKQQDILQAQQKQSHSIDSTCHTLFNQQQWIQNELKYLSNELLMDKSSSSAAEVILTDGPCDRDQTNNTAATTSYSKTHDYFCPTSKTSTSSSLDTLVQKLIRRLLTSPQDPYVALSNDKQQREMDLLLFCNIVEYHPHHQHLFRLKYHV